MDPSVSESVDNFRKLLNLYTDMINPKSKIEREETKQQMESVFNKMFKSGEDGTPTPITMEIEDPIDGDAEFSNKSIKDLS